MGLLDLLSTSKREPASCVVEVGADRTEIADFYPLISALDVRTSRADAGTGKIVFVAHRDEAGQLVPADSGLLAPWSPIRVSAEFGTEREEIIRGYVKQATLRAPQNAGEAVYEVEFQDDSLVLDRGHMRDVWGSDDAPLSDKDIATAIAAEYGLKLAADSHDGQANRPRNQDDTPIKFLRERAKANGFELLFQEGEVYFGPMRLSGEAQETIKIHAGRDTNCLGFNVTEDAMKPDKVRFDVAPKTGTQPETETIAPATPVLGKKPAAADGADLHEFAWRVSREGDETADEARVRAQALADQNAMKLTATGELDGALYGHVLKVGRLVAVDGVGNRLGGLYYVDQVEHAFTPDGYRQRFTLIRNATGETDAPSGPLGALSALGGLF
jgi:hypothetical protein